MGIGKSLKNFYFALEGKYYGMLDKLENVIPVYKIVDPIDKIVPSFILFVAVAIILIGFLAFALPGMGQVETAAITLLVQNEYSANGLSGVDVSYSYAGVTGSAVSDAEGMITLNVPIGETLTIEIGESEIGGKDYEAYINHYFVDSSVLEIVELIEKIAASTKVTVYLEDELGGRILGKNITVELSCSNSSAVLSQRVVSDQDRDGMIVVDKPANCGVFSARPTVNGYETASYALTRAIETLQLEAVGIELEETKGNLSVTVRDDDGALLNEVDFRVTLRDSDEAFVDSENTGSYAEADFEELLTGLYSVTVTDESMNYASGYEREILVEKDETKYVAVTVGKTIKATVTVTVVNEDSDAEIEGAEVRVKTQEGEIENSGVTDEDGEVVFVFRDVKDYYVDVMHEDYLPESTEPETWEGDVDVEVAMELLTAENSGRLRVKVVDEDLLAVENAKVKLMYGEGSKQGFLAPYEIGITDVNGWAYVNGENGWKGLRGDEAYYAFVEKYPASGSNINDARRIDVKEINEFIVHITIGNSTIAISAYNGDDELIAGAEAEIFDEQGESLGRVPLPNGTADYEMKADRSVYVVVSHADYMTVQSMVRQLWPDEYIRFDVKMPARYLAENPKVEFLGIFSREREERKMEAGKEYETRFRIFIPEGSGYESAGLHFRTGNETLLINDPMGIRKVNAARASVVKGTEYHPTLGYESDAESIVDEKDFGKWVNIVWNSPESSVREVAVGIKVKDEVLPGVMLPLHYRIWAVDNGSYLREPEDAELGTGESTAVKQALYANTFSKEYYEGETPTCNDFDFCYSGEEVYGDEEELYIEYPYVLRVYSPYTLKFDITNESNRLHEGSELYIESVESAGVGDKVLKISETTVRTTTAQIFQNNDVDAFKVEKIDLGDFTKGKSISVNLDFNPREIRIAHFEVRIVSEGRVVFSRMVEFEVVSDNDMFISVSPNLLPSFVTNNVTAEVTGETGMEIEDAKVTVTRTSTDNSEIDFIEYTNAIGVAEFAIPPSSPGTVLKFEAEKTGYYAEPVEKTIDGNILILKPEKMHSILKVGESTEEFFDITIQNLIGFGLEFKELKIDGDRVFRELLDVTAMQNYLTTYWVDGRAEVLAEEEETFIDFLRVVLRHDAGSRMREGKTAEGTLLVSMWNPMLGEQWDFEIEVDVRIELGGLPDNAPCIVIDRVNWEGVTRGGYGQGKATLDIEVENTCVSNGIAAGLQDLKAKIEWDGTAMGSVDLTLTDNANPQVSASKTLKSNAWSTYFEGIPGEASYHGLVTFTPTAGFLGEEAGFRIYIDGSVLVEDGGMVGVGSTPEFIDSRIKIINLEQCITYDSDNTGPYLEVAASEEAVGESSFTIDISECGQTNVEFYLCRSDSDCSGGTAGGIGVTPKNFTLSPAQPTKTIKVSEKRMPGIYGLTVHAKTPGSNYREVKTVDVLIRPHTWNNGGTEYFELVNYDFEVLGEGATDATDLINYMFMETVDVKADYCAWDEVMEDDTMERLSGAMGVAYLFSSIHPIGAIVGLFVGMSLFGGQSCSDLYKTMPLTDTVIALSGDSLQQIFDDGNLQLQVDGDAKEIGLFKNINGDSAFEGRISVEWELENSRRGEDTEKVGIAFTNTGMSEPKPAYAVLWVEALEHIHGDVTHSGGSLGGDAEDVECENGNFSAMNIGASESEGSCKGAGDTTYEQMFHVRFRTQSIEETYALPRGADQCLQGTMQGATGTEALPKVSFRWDWGEDMQGWNMPITYNACDTENENGIYCDATQFSIELSKKLHLLDEFLAENSYEFKCPLDPSVIDADDKADEDNADGRTSDVENEMLGLSEVAVTRSGTSAEAVVEIENRTDNAQNAEVRMVLTRLGSDYEQTCTKTMAYIANDDSETVTCDFSGVVQSRGAYVLVVTLTDTTAEAGDTDGDALSYVFYNRSSASSDDCFKPRTTEYSGSYPAIEYFINPDMPTFGQYVQDTVEWTEGVPDIEALRELIHFRSYLMKDGYSDDFRKDFAEFYSAGFFEADESFNEIKNYFDSDEKMSFTRKHIGNSSQLYGPGVYEVDVDIEFGDDWKLFNSSGMPAAEIVVAFNRVDAAYPNSPFYYMPFDGQVGVETENGRQGYGMDYRNNQNEIMITSSNILLKTTPVTSSNPIVNLITAEERGMETLNSVASTRGMLLKIEDIGENEKYLAFSPNFATPVLMKMSGEVTEQPFSAFYELRENETARDVGGSSGFWTGMGQCRDFKGDSVGNVFNYVPDREASDNDPLPKWEYAYATDWIDGADYAGDVYLWSMVYTPAESGFALHVLQPDGLQFKTPDSGFGVAADLSGISGMLHNSRSSGSVSEIQEVFDLVAGGQACITNSGIGNIFWWNPAVLYESAGSSGPSMNMFEETLEMGETCIG